MSGRRDEIEEEYKSEDEGEDKSGKRNQQEKWKWGSCEEEYNERGEKEMQ